MTRPKPIYDEIRTSHLKKVQSNDIELCHDFEIEKDNGNRGYVLQISLENGFYEYEEFISQFILLEPDQYYVKRKDLHLTVFEFCSVRADYSNYANLIDAYRSIAGNILLNFRPFCISFCGTVFTSGSGIISGYDDDILLEIRRSLRKDLQLSGLPNLERYESKTAHVSFMAYRQKFADDSRFLDIIEKNRKTFIGNFLVEKMELVEHDWYNRHETKRVIEEYKLEKIS